MIVKSVYLSFLLLGSVSASSHEAKDKGSAETTTPTGKKSVWSPEMDQITCCNGGVPTVSEALVKNVTIIPSDYTIEERTVDDVTMNCRDYEVRYLAQRSPALSDSDNEFNEEIKLKCKCPDANAQTLDSNCRRLQNCKNNGFRSSTSHRHCVCPQPFFGERCEKYCDQGQRLKSHTGRDYCSCLPFYQGEECREMVCLNGGREENGRCICLQQFLGYHCEINTNHTGTGGSRFQRFGDQGEMFTRDRFPATMTIAGGPGSNNCLTSGRPDLISPDDPRLYSFRPMSGVIPDTGPPPYFQRGRRSREVLPPLPTYEDATKLPPLRSNIPNDDSIEETTELSARSERNESTQQSGHVSADQTSSTPETIIATVRGNEMVRPATNRQSDSSVHSSHENAETASINSTATASSESSVSSNASSKPEQR
ncbi:Protein cueball [Aphelenchoides bicaudatus]|nr:Protein cueball [Aphelenchoides bicaudatus]